MKTNTATKNSKNTVSLPNFKIEQSNKIDITANSGLFLLAELIKKIGLLEKLARLNIFQRQKIGEAVHTLTLVLNQFIPTGRDDAIYDTVEKLCQGSCDILYVDGKHPSNTIY